MLQTSSQALLAHTAWHAPPATQGLHSHLTSLCLHFLPCCGRLIQYPSSDHRGTIFSASLPLWQVRPQAQALASLLRLTALWLRASLSKAVGLSFRSCKLGKYLPDQVLPARSPWLRPVLCPSRSSCSYFGKEVLEMPSCSLWKAS